jgi:hypothetical protein
MIENSLDSVSERKIPDFDPKDNPMIASFKQAMEEKNKQKRRMVKSKSEAVINLNSRR